MALVLYLEGRRLPSKVKTCFSTAAAGSSSIIIPSLVLAEIGYLAERGRITTNLPEIDNLLARNTCFSIKELDLEIVKQAFQIMDIPELHDRLIAATAAHLGIPLLTNDPSIEKSITVQTIWK